MDTTADEERQGNRQITFNWIEQFLVGGDFIPSQVGLTNLQERMIGFPSEDDHVWHELAPDGMEPTDEEPTIDLTAQELLHAFRRATWDVVGTLKELGIPT